MYFVNQELLKNPKALAEIFDEVIQNPVQTNQQNLQKD